MVHYNKSNNSKLIKYKLLKKNKKLCKKLLGKSFCTICINFNYKIIFSGEQVYIFFPASTSLTIFFTKFKYDWSTNRINKIQNYHVYVQMTTTHDLIKHQYIKTLSKASVQTRN